MRTQEENEEEKSRGDAGQPTAFDWSGSTAATNEANRSREMREPFVCRRCLEPLRKDSDGDWMDAETHLTCPDGNRHEVIAADNKHPRYPFDFNVETRRSHDAD